jgi:transcriptional regulator with XRE-family HTH domain
LDPRESLKAQLAHGLRALRRLRGLSQDQLAKELYVTRETIAAYESGRNRPDEKFCKTSTSAPWSCSRASGTTLSASTYASGWRRISGTRTRPARSARFEPLYIPGLLQTEEYIRAIWRPHALVEEKVAQRLARRDILTQEDDPPYLFAVIDQAALVRPIGGAQVMKEQLRHLLTMSELPSVTIQVVELSVGWYFGLNGAIVVFTKPDASRVGLVEAQFGGRLIEDPPQLARLGLRFDLIRGKALSEEASRALIRTTMETMSDDQVA